MARRKTSTRTITKVVRAPAPVIRVSAPRAIKKHHRRRHHGGGSTSTVVGAAIGGAAYGWIEKSFPAMPTVPVLGRAGTVALVGFIAQKKGFGGQIVRDITIAAAVIAGYQLGRTGHVAGGDVSRQVGGIAAQV